MTGPELEQLHTAFATTAGRMEDAMLAMRAVCKALADLAIALAPLAPEKHLPSPLPIAGTRFYWTGDEKKRPCVVLGWGPEKGANGRELLRWQYEDINPHVRWASADIFLSGSIVVGGDR